MKLLLFLLLLGHAAIGQTPVALQSTPNTAGLKLPAGFKAAITMPELGRNRHIAVNTNGDIYVKLDRVKNTKGIMVLREDASGRAQIIDSFGTYSGTGIVIKNGYLYASSDREVFRYELDENNKVINRDAPERIITGLLAGRQHQTKSIALDNAGNIYVNIGVPSNSCQEIDRGPGSKGIDPCPFLDSAAAIWQFKADRPDQSYPEGVRYAMGIRNVVGLDCNNENPDDILGVSKTN